MEKEELHAIIDEMGFYDLVRVARRLLEMAYPLDLFDGSSGDSGAVFTAKLHEALNVLPPNNPKK